MHADPQKKAQQQKHTSIHNGNEDGIRQLKAESTATTGTGLGTIAGGPLAMHFASPSTDSRTAGNAATGLPGKNNTGLPDSLKAGIEQLSGLAMDSVQVHYNSAKPAQLQAYAYAQGTDIYLAPGQEQHLPHEAWHVVQQMRGDVATTVQLKGAININDDSALEREADIMGEAAVNAGRTHDRVPTKIETAQPANHGDVIQRAGPPLIAVKRIDTGSTKTVFIGGPGETRGCWIQPKESTASKDPILGENGEIQTLKRLRERNFLFAPEAKDTQEAPEYIEYNLSILPGRWLTRKNNALTNPTSIMELNNVTVRKNGLLDYIFDNTSGVGWVQSNVRRKKQTQPTLSAADLAYIDKLGLAISQTPSEAPDKISATITPSPKGAWVERISDIAIDVKPRTLGFTDNEANNTGGVHREKQGPSYAKVKATEKIGGQIQELHQEHNITQPQKARLIDDIDTMIRRLQDTTDADRIDTVIGEYNIVITNNWTIRILDTAPPDGKNFIATTIGRSDDVINGLRAIKQKINALTAITPEVVTEATTATTNDSV